MKYNHEKVEAKWQAFWKDNKTYAADDSASEPKYYVLDMFPYPSGAGLHVGHVAGYTASDIVARHKRQLGFNVLHPMGWDSFGLPAEQYAIRTGTHPAITTKRNVDNFRTQLMRLGFSYDWDREITTSDPDYYKWTQWIFTKLYERGLAYEADILVNYCPVLGTVLANEEIEEGKSVIGGHPVERKPLKQWVLKITAYAERLLEDLELLDWPESLKCLQRNWIGKSVGAQVDFVETKTGEEIRIFTTRPDTLFGATYMVLAPEHPLLETIGNEDVQHYQKLAALKSDMERTELAKEKTGVFTGHFAKNPVNGQNIPIWVSDYVLISYGTGAIMSVPAHDERDFEFANKFHLPIVPVFDPDFQGNKDMIPEGMTGEELRQKVLSGKQCWTGPGKSISSKNAQINLEGMDVPSAIQAVTLYLEEQGLGEKATNYKLRDWLFSRQRYWGEPFPILHFEDGTKRCLGLDELPLCPPELQDYKPQGDGKSPLERASEWITVQDEKTGKSARRESNTMPQWAGSCWYYLRFVDPKNEQKAWSRDKEQYWLPVDLYIGGVEHAVLHLLYARFWHKVLYDIGEVSTKEPFQKLRNQGLIVANSYRLPDGAYVEPESVRQEGKIYIHKDSGQEVQVLVEKMSKSKLNGASPDEVIQAFGADSLRLYEMFMGPLEKEKLWNSNAVSGCYRFLKRFSELVNNEKVTDDVLEEANKLGHRLVYAVRRDLEQLSFNTAIAKMMEFVNHFSKLRCYPRSVLKMAVQCLYPFAPHLGEELWQQLGGESPVSQHPFPKVDEDLLTEDKVTFVVQVNGKLRAKLDMPRDCQEQRVQDLAMEDPNVAKYLNGSQIRKVIFVPNKLLNFVV